MHDISSHLAEDGAANLRSAKHEEVIERLRAEHDNMRQALRWSLDTDEIDFGLRLAGALYRFWLYNDNGSEGSWWLESFSLAARSVPDAVQLRPSSVSGAWRGTGSDGPFRNCRVEEAVDLYQGVSPVNPAPDSTTPPP